MNVQEILSEIFTDVVMSSKEARCSDITIGTAKGKVLVEVKDYSKTVPTEEVNKFRRDLMFSGAIGGIFISMSSSIAKIASFSMISVEGDNGSIPCIFISAETLSKNTIKKLLEVSVKIICTMINPKSLSADLYSRVYTETSRIIELTKNLNSSKELISELINNNQKSLSKIYLSISKSELQMEIAATSIIRIIEPINPIDPMNAATIIKKSDLTLDKLLHKFAYCKYPELCVGLIQLGSDVIEITDNILDCGKFKLKLLKTRSDIIMEKISGNIIDNIDSKYITYSKGTFIIELNASTDRTIVSIIK
jgi:hypothetical protein